MFFTYFLQGFLAAYITARVSEYYCDKAYDEVVKKVKEAKRKRELIKPIEDVLTEEEKKTLMRMELGEDV